MKLEIYQDPFDIDDWDMTNKSRCFVHFSNSLVWKAITGEHPPTVPFTAKEYTNYGLPWFEYYSDNSTALTGSKKLQGLKSVVEMGKEKSDNPLPENESVDPEKILKLRKNPFGFPLTPSCQFVFPHAELKTARQAWSYMAIGHMWPYHDALSSRFGQPLL